MKKNFLFRSLILVVIFSAGLFSCAKDKESLYFSSRNADQAATETNPDRRFMMMGSVTGKVIPLFTHVQITVFNVHFTKSNFYYMKDGSFRIDGIPPGFYTVNILETSTLDSRSFSDVKITYGFVANLGIIKL